MNSVIMLCGSSLDILYDDRMFLCFPICSQTHTHIYTYICIKGELYCRGPHGKTRSAKGINKCLYYNMTT